VTFVQRLVDVTIKLAANTGGSNQPSSFSGTDGANTITLSKHRVSCQIQNAGAPGGCSATVVIYGLSLQEINEFATLGQIFKLVPNNLIVVSAGDATSGMGVVFGGTIMEAYADFQNVPDVPFRIIAQSGGAEAVVPVPATSYTGPTDVATAMSSLATLAGWGFENDGVSNGAISQKVPSPYLPGSIMAQVRKLAETAGINAELVPAASFPGGSALTLAIWKKGDARKAVVPVIAPPPQGQMIRYPSYQTYGVVVQTLFDRQLSFGGQVKIQGSSLVKVNGTWNIGRLDHTLESLVPGGRWESSVYCYDPKAPFPALPTH
jgi:hypothetical protein